MIRNLVIIISSSALLTACLYLPGGSNTRLKTNPNNDHTKKVVLFLREGGATVGRSYQVSIFKYDSEFDSTEVGNTFTVDTDHGKTRLDSSSISFVWISDDTLKINYDKKLRTFIQQKKVNGITIIYNAL